MRKQLKFWNLDLFAIKKICQKVWINLTSLLCDVVIDDITLRLKHTSIHNVLIYMEFLLTNVIFFPLMNYTTCYVITEKELTESCDRNEVMEMPRFTYLFDLFIRYPGIHKTSPR